MFNKGWCLLSFEGKKKKRNGNGSYFANVFIYSVTDINNT